MVYVKLETPPHVPELRTEMDTRPSANHQSVYSITQPHKTQAIESCPWDSCLDLIEKVLVNC